MPLKTDKIVPALKAAQKAGVDVEAALDQLTELVSTTATVTPKPITVLTTIGQKSDGSPLVVAWSTCGECKAHVTRCECSKGPTMPSYVAKWVAEYEEKHSPEAAKRLSTTVGSPETAEGSFPAEGVPVSGKSRSRTGGDEKQAKAVPLAKGPACSSCSKPVSEENADKNDDDTWTCFDCQEGGK